MKGAKERTMARKFKNVTISQMMELRDKLSDKLAHGCSIEDALFYVQCYAAVDELLEIKGKGPLFDWTDIKASAPPEDKEVLCVDIDGDIWMAHYSKISKAWYACGYGDRIKDIVAWMEVPDYKGKK